MYTRRLWVCGFFAAALVSAQVPTSPAIQVTGDIKQSLSLTADDLGNAGAGGAKTSTANLVLNVAFVNTAPVLSGANNLLLTLEDPVIDPGTPVSGPNTS